MQSEFSKRLLSAIKDDNLERFSSLVKDRRELLTLCYGRFPVLSLCYLYRSGKILGAFSVDLKKINGYTYVEEDFATYLKFKRVAGKSLRLYTGGNKIVTPLEMLAIIDDTGTLKAEYEAKIQTEDTTAKLKKVFAVKYSENIKTERGKLQCHKSKLSGIAICLLVFVLIVCSMTIIAAGGVKTLTGNMFGTGTVGTPYKVSNGAMLELAIANNLGYVVLENDIAVSSSFSVENYSGSIDGNGHKITVGADRSKPVINTLQGNISNVTIEIDESTTDAVRTVGLFIGSKNANGTIENVDIYFRNTIYYDVTDDSTIPFIIYTDSQLASAIERNSGYIELAADVTLNKDVHVDTFDGSIDGGGHRITFEEGRSKAVFGKMNGKITNVCFLAEDISYEAGGQNGIVTYESDSGQMSKGGMIANENNGEISNLDLKFNGLVTDIDIYDEASSEEYVYTYFALIAGTNNGTIQDVTAAGELEVVGNGSGDFFFGVIAGINASTITNAKVGASTLNLDTVDAGGIAAENTMAGTISGCVSDADFNTKSTKSGWSLLGGGIAVINYGVIENCVNHGDISGTLEYSEGLGTPHIGGITAYNYYLISKCLNKGDISFEVYNGYCVNLYIGGIAGEQSFDSTVNNQLRSYAYSEMCGNYGKLSAESGQKGNVITTQSDGTQKTTEYDNYLFVGGLFGSSYGGANQCFSAGIVSCNILDENKEPIEDSKQAYAGGIIGLGEYDNNMVYTYFDWYSGQYYTSYSGWVSFYSDNYYISGNGATLSVDALCSYGSRSISGGVAYGADVVESEEALKNLEVYWDEE